MIKCYSPGRTGIIGNPSDGYGGAVLSCTIKNRATVLIESAEKLVISYGFKSRLIEGKDDFNNQGDHFDVVRAVLRYFELFDLRAKITITTSIPVQAGLAGSTAALSALLSAVLTYIGESYDNYYLAELTRFLEYNYLGYQCGYQDAYMTTFGGLTYLDFRGKEYYRELGSEPYATVECLGQFVGELPFVIAHTGIKHHSGKFHRPVRERWMEGEKQVVQGYEEITALAREGKKALLTCNWDKLAWLMNENHRIQDEIAFSGKEINYFIKTARNNGALAAKLAGAGGGGTIIVLTFEREKTISALRQAGVSIFIELSPGSDGITVDTVGREAAPDNGARY